MNRFCSKCATPLPDSAQFCPNCAAPVAKLEAGPADDEAPFPLEEPDIDKIPTAPHPVLVTSPPPAAAAAPERQSPTVRSSATPVKSGRGKMWIAIPIVIVLLILVLLAILSGMPFGKKDGPVAERKSSQVKKSEAPPLSGTVREIQTEPSSEQGDAQFTILEPNVEGGIVPAAAPSTKPSSRPATPSTRPTGQPVPAPVSREESSVPTNVPATPRVEPGEDEISDEEAVATLQGFLDARNFYEIDDSCLSVRSLGYQNAGYTLEATDRCEGRSLGRWRVDSKTRELYRQRADGKYRRP